MIIVTGCDNTGKTSLVEHLQKTFNLEQPPRYSPLPPVDFSDWAKYNKRQFELANEGHQYIYDRLFIDELVYGPIKRKRYGATVEDMAIMSNMLVTVQPLFIYTYVPEEVILKTFDERDQYIDRGEITQTLKRFREVMNTWPVNQLVNKTTFNFTNDSNYARITLVVGNYLRNGGIK